MYKEISKLDGLNLHNRIMYEISIRNKTNITLCNKILEIHYKNRRAIDLFYNLCIKGELEEKDFNKKNHKRYNTVNVVHNLYNKILKLKYIQEFTLEYNKKHPLMNQHLLLVASKIFYIHNYERTIKGYFDGYNEKMINSNTYIDENNDHVVFTTQIKENNSIEERFRSKHKTKHYSAKELEIKPVTDSPELNKCQDVIKLNIDLRLPKNILLKTIEKIKDDLNFKDTFEHIFIQNANIKYAELFFCYDHSLKYNEYNKQILEHNKNIEIRIKKLEKSHQKKDDKEKLINQLISKKIYLYKKNFRKALIILTSINKEETLANSLTKLNKYL